MSKILEYLCGVKRRDLLPGSLRPDHLHEVLPDPTVRPGPRALHGLAVQRELVGLGRVLLHLVAVAGLDRGRLEEAVEHAGHALGQGDLQDGHLAGDVVVLLGLKSETALCGYFFSQLKS